MIFEQLLMAADATSSEYVDLGRQHCQTIQALVNLDVDLSQSPGQWDVDLVEVIMSIIATASPEHEPHLTGALEALLAGGVRMTARSLCYATETDDFRRYLSSISGLSNFEGPSSEAYVYAARLNSFEVVDLLLAAGVPMDQAIPKE